MRDAPAVVTSPTILICPMSAVTPKPGRLVGYLVVQTRLIRTISIDSYYTNGITFQ
jgi:hypothetical protein